MSARAHKDSFQLHKIRIKQGCMGKGIGKIVLHWTEVAVHKCSHN